MSEPPDSPPAPDPSPVPKASSLNTISLILLFSALPAFILFHFVSWQGSPGWEIWPDIWEALSDGQLIDDPHSMAIVMAILSVTFTVVTAPFLAPFLRRSRPLHVLMASISGLAAATLVFFILTEGYNPMAALITATCFLNFSGLLCLRRTIPKPTHEWQEST